MTEGFFKKNNIKQFKWPVNSPDLNIIANSCSIVDNKLLKFSMNSLDDLKKGIENAWCKISTDSLEKFFQSMAKRVRHGIDFEDLPCNY